MRVCVCVRVCVTVVVPQQTMYVVNFSEMTHVYSHVKVIVCVHVCV